MIKLISVTKRYIQNQILQEVSYEFEDKGCYFLMGESGCGKTTLLNILAGLIPFEKGTIEYDGIAFETLFSGIENYDYITQDTYFVNYLTVYENLEIVKNDKDRIMAVLSELGIEKLCNSFPEKLSGGERQRLALARAMLSESSVIFMDEPTASLDRENKTAIFSILKRMSETRLIVWATHDRKAEPYTDHILKLSKTPPAKSVPNLHRQVVAHAERVQQKRAPRGPFLRNIPGRKTRGQRVYCRLACFPLAEWP